MRLLIVLLTVCLSLARAQPEVNPALPSGSVNTEAKVQRQGIADLEFDPDEGAVVLQLLEADGAARLTVDSVELEAIGDQAERGRTIRAVLTRSSDAAFRGTLNLSEGTWNVIARVRKGELELVGQYALGVGKAVTVGRFALVPPNPEVGRLTMLFAWLFGVPLALGVIVTLVTVVWKPGSRRAAKGV
jgi:hypothetical protein